MWCLLLLISATWAQGTGAEWWTANFIQTSGSTGSGANAGVFRFNWPNRIFSIQFGSRWTETYQFNTNRGYSPVTDGSLQTRSELGGTCNPQCGIALIDNAMPPLAPSLSSYVSTGGGSPCVTYTPSQAVANQFITSYTASGTGAATKICSITFKDGRIFTIDQASFAWGNVAITPPSNCKCDNQMDIWILVDHSSSISDSKMVQFKTFVQQFLDSLDISANGINVGMSWFHYKTGVNFNITGNIATINTAMNKWWTNCSNPATVTYCGNNPLDAGCQGCQASATATSTGIQGYSGSTTSPNWPSGNMNVVGAMTYFYDPSYGGSVRQVPKMFLTLTDGAVNHFRNQNGGVGGCYFSACSPDLIAAVAALRAKHNSLFPSVSLTTVAMGIGAPGSDPNLSLSPEHLEILAEGKDANWFTAPNFDVLSSYLRNLLLVSCPAANDIQKDTCLHSCCGLCICNGQCLPPSQCIDENICTDQQLAACCNTVNTAITTACPTADKCTNAVCNAAITGGRCSYTPVDCSSFANGCIRYQCTPSTGACTTANTSLCPPQDCTWGPWSSWSACSVTCGDGTQTQTRSINQTAANGGVACTGSNTNTRACNQGCCPVNCQLSGWSAWSTCSQCGTGTRTRTRTVNTPASCGGAACGALSETVDCPACVNTNCVGVNNTGTCNCTTRTARITYSITTQQQGTGTPCPYPDGTSWIGSCTATQLNNCPVPCVEQWTAWSDCDCFRFWQNRSYGIISRPRNGGTPCSYANNFSETRACTPTPQQNCPLYGPTCTTAAECGDGFACTLDRCIRQADGNLHCDWSQPTPCNPNFCFSNNSCDQIRGCLQVLKQNPCPTPDRCNISTCDQSLNGGAGGCSYRAVNCSGIVQPGDPCQTFKCNPSTGGCTVADRSACPPVDCTWSDWSAWSTCTKTCGNGTTTQTRYQNQTAKDGGLACVGPSKNTTSCNEQCCVIDCVMTTWSNWSACALCSAENQTRTRSITTPASCGGAACGNITETQQCPCTPADCSYINKTGSCACSADGFGGTTILTVVYQTQQVGSGAPCPFADGTQFNQTCNASQIAACPKPCIEELTNWSVCNCYFFKETQDYRILQQPANGGTPCNYSANFTTTRDCVPAQNCSYLGPPCTFDSDCNDEIACTLDRCIFVDPPGGTHCNWTGNVVCTSYNICEDQYCDNTIGCRRTNKSAEVACPPKDKCESSACDATAGLNGSCIYKQKDCSAFTDGCQKYLCNGTTGDCSIPDRSACPPIPCVWNNFSEWTACSVACGNGTQTRSRTINTTAQDGGANCTGNDTETQTCDAGCCPVDCVHSEWTPWNSSHCGLCDPGSQIRTRTIITNSSCNGTLCGAVNDTSMKCPPCAPVNCSGYNTSTTCNCSKDGTVGTKSITYVVSLPKVGTGLDCPHADGQNWTEPCNATEINGCPKPCIERYTNWSICDCFNNSQWRLYEILQNATNGGVPCTNKTGYVDNQTCKPTDDQQCPQLGPACKIPEDCYDGNNCTEDRCIQVNPPGTYHCDWTQPVVCDNSSLCHNVTCDPLQGCVANLILFCEDNNNCTIDYCDNKTGCVHENVTCEDKDVCNLAFCDPVSGCTFEKRNCSFNLTEDDNCTLYYCDINYTQNKLNDPCVKVDNCAVDLVLPAAISAGVIAAIIIAGIICAALATGGVVAATSQLGNTDESATVLNPLYIGSNVDATNPLFETV